MRLNKSWFRRLLISYLPVLFIVATILFILFFQALNAQNREEALKANEFLASQVIRHIDNTLKRIDYKVLREILTSKAIGDFFNHASADDVLMNIEAVEVMDELKFNEPFVDSVYFVRFRDHNVLSSGKIISLEAFADREFIETYENKEMSGVWSGYRPFKPFSGEPVKEVITLVREVPKMSGLFVVNVSVNQLRKSVAQMYDTGISFVRIIDSKGMELMAGERIEEVRNRDAASEVFSTFTSQYTGWKVESGLVNGSIVKLGLTLFDVSFGFAIAVVCVGAAWVFYVTMRNYRPIQQIVTLLKTVSAPQQEALEQSSQNEFHYIHSALEKMIVKSEQHQKYAEALHKKYLFQEVLRGPHPVTEDLWMKEMGKYRLPTRLKPLAVIVTEIDRYEQFAAKFNHQDQSLLKFSLSSVVQEIAQQFGITAWTEWVSNRRCSSILWLPEQGGGEERLRSMLESYRQWVERHLKMTVTIGCGKWVQHPEALRESYASAVQALQHKAVLGLNRVIGFERTGEPHAAHSLHKSVSSIAQALRLLDDGWERHVETFFQNIRKAHLTRNEIGNLFQFLVNLLDLEYSQQSKENRELWNRVLADVNSWITGWETVEELQFRCTEMLRDLTGRLQALRDSRSNRVQMLAIRQFIDENYANPDLSLKYLSDKFQLSDKYLSKLFKEEFGENFIDYLIRIRIENAKRLMVETDMPIRDISGEVGYTNYISFNRCFKNVVGLSPRDFRNINVAN
jgi:AraC-like DNA-binding protein